MNKIISILLLAVLAMVLYTQIKRNGGKSEPLSFDDDIESNGTIIVPDLIMHQPIGRRDFTHNIRKEELEVDGKMTGISVSRPNAPRERTFPNGRGILLETPKSKKTDDPVYNVSLNAFLIGYDSKGFYGKVYRSANEFKVFENGKWKTYSKGATFNILDGTQIKIGHQLLWFEIPVVSEKMMRSTSMETIIAPYSDEVITGIGSRN